MRHRRPRGFSLLELVLSMFILTILMVVLFSVFSSGSRNFRQLVTRQGLQAEARQISALIRRDLILSHFRSADVTPTQDAYGQERDALSFVTMDSWNTSDNGPAPARFDETLRPRWNRYVIWYATRDDSEKLPPLGSPQRGQLIRKVVDVGPIAYPLPMLTITGSPVDGFLTSPGGGGGVNDYKVVTSHLLSYQVSLAQDIESVNLHIVLRDSGGVAPGGVKPIVETFECFLDIHPENTWPAY